MKTNTLMSVIGSLVSALTLSSCVTWDIPVGGGPVPVYQQGGPSPGYGRPYDPNGGGDFNPGNGYHGRQPGGGYYGGNQGSYNGGPNTGPPIFYGSQRQTVYGSGDQSYARMGQPRPTTYQGRNW